MIEHQPARLAKHEGRLTSRLMDLIRGLLRAILFSPVMAVSFPVVAVMARERNRARGRLIASTATGAASSSAPEGRLVLDASRVSGAVRDCRGFRVAPNVASAGSSRTPVGVATPVCRGGLVTRDDELYSVVRVDPPFNPRAYDAVFAALQLPPGSKLLDLTPARMLSADVFERLAAAWMATPGTVPRLGILLSFERWVMFRDAAVSGLQPVTATGVKIELFYAQQAEGAGLAAWFSHGQLVHNVPAVVHALTVQWQPSATWPRVIETLAGLVRAHTLTEDLPKLLTHLAGLALSCGGAAEAATLASEALYYMPRTPPSATQSCALRELGVALLVQGELAAGLAALDEAIAVAASAEDPGAGATALCQSGMYALNHGDHVDAERRFRRAVELLTPTRRRQLLAQAHHGLAVALMSLGSEEAEQHAVTALALRPDKASPRAEEDRILLAKIRESHKN